MIRNTVFLYGSRISLAEARFLRSISNLWSRRGLNSFFIAFTRFGDWPLFAILAFGLAVRMGWSGVRALSAEALAVSMAVSVFVVVKKVAHRPRPYEKHPDLTFLLAPPDRFSFPSGHTMTSFALWAAVSVFVPVLGPFLLVCAALIGASRVYLGCHYPTDVLAGAILGGFLGKLAAASVLMIL